MSKRSRKNPENENENEKGKELENEKGKETETIVLSEELPELSLSAITNKTYSKPKIIDFTTSEYTQVPLTTSATWGLRENPVKQVPKYHLSKINEKGERVFESYYNPGKNIWGGITKRKQLKRNQSKRKQGKRKQTKRKKRSTHKKRKIMMR